MFYSTYLIFLFKTIVEDIQGHHIKLDNSSTH